MRRTCRLQKGGVLSFTVRAMLVFGVMAFAPPGETSTTESFGSLQSQTPTAVLAQRIERVENGLLPPAVLKGETPVGMKLSDRMHFYKTPGLSVALINDGRIEWARGYGVLETGGEEPVTTETLFQAASISKPVTALAALKLVEQKKLDLDEDVNRKLVSWKVPENEFTKEQKVTLRRLLSHSAGLTVSGFLGYADGEQLPSLLQILDGQKPPANSSPIRVDAVPGRKWRYAGGGYVVVQQLLIDVTATPFEQFMQKTVLKKLGMMHSTFQQPLPPDLGSRAAAGHLPDGKMIKGKWFVYPEQAPAGLWSNPSDLARVAIEIQKSYQGKSNRVLTRAMTGQMLTPQIETSGLGLFVEGRDNSSRFIFSGSNVGFKSYMVGYLNAGQGAVIMTNSENGAQLVMEVLRSIAAEYAWPDYRPREKVVVKVDPAIYDSLIGQYEIAPGFILTVTKEGERLMSQAPGQSKSEMFPESETTFFLKDADAQFTFIKDETGKVVQVNVRRGTREFKARKIS